MPRPATKPDLIAAANDQFEKMLTLIDTMPEEAQSAPFGFGDSPSRKEAHWARDKNLRDVLVHLYEWHGLLLNWVNANQRGEKKPFLPEPYNWKTYGDMNVGFFEKHQDTPLDAAKEMVKKSHNDVMALIETFSGDDLFKKGALPWTGSSTLGSYCASNTASHYDWAMKKIKLHKKTV